MRRTSEVGPPETVRLLLAAGLDKIVQNSTGAKAIALALLNHHHKTVRLLRGCTCQPGSASAGLSAS